MEGVCTCMLRARLPSRGVCRGVPRVYDCVRSHDCVYRYLHKEHAFYDLDDEVEELNETIGDRRFTTGGTHEANSSSSQSVRSAGELREGEYDY